MTKTQIKETERWPEREWRVAGKRIFLYEYGIKIWCIEPYSMIGEGGHMSQKELQAIADCLNATKPKP